MASYQSIYQPYANAAAQKYGIDPSLLSSVIKTESNWNPYAVNKSGAAGIAQFMPGTAQQFKLNPWDPVASIDAAGRYLSQLYKKYGSWDKALGVYGGDISGTGEYARKVLSQVTNPGGLGAGSGSGVDATGSATPTPGFFGPLIDWFLQRGAVILLLLLAIALVYLGARAMFDQGRAYVANNSGLKLP